MTSFVVYRNGNAGSRPKTFTKSDTVCMNVIWRHFNNYARKNGFTERVEDSAYLGALEWCCPATGIIMELREAC